MKIIYVGRVDLFDQIFAADLLEFIVEPVGFQLAEHGDIIHQPGQGSGLVCNGLDSFVPVFLGPDDAFLDGFGIPLDIGDRRF